MPDGIEGQPPLSLGSGIAKLARDEAVGNLVEHDRDDEGHEPDGDLVDDACVHVTGVMGGRARVKRRSFSSGPRLLA